MREVSGVAARVLPELTRITPETTRPAQVIGRGLGHTLIDLHQDLAPDLFGAAAGAVTAGHLLVCLLPEQSALTASPYGSWFWRGLRHDPQVCWLTPTHAHPGQPLPRSEPAEAVADCLSADQARALNLIKQTVKGRARRPLVVTADRGRGKSAALGLAARELQTEDIGPLLITAPSQAAAGTALEHACGQDKGQAAALRFIAPDELLSTLPDCHALFVDEAAALPVPMLSRLLQHYPRVVFATTQHGYEGMGRGFSLRFRRILEQRTPAWRSVELHEPIRFGCQDVLEPLVMRLLCLDADLTEAPTALGTAAVTWLDGARLAEDESLLRSVFSLLVLAHYRTRPSDLRQLLNDPSQHLGILRDGQQLVGCILLASEGDQSRALAEAMSRGQRRPQGQQGAGVLAAQAGLVAGATLRSLRVVRIVVHPDAQRRGLGRFLLQAAHDHALERKADFLSSTFGATAELLCFWQSAGYQPLWLGLRRAARSGEHGMLVARPLTGDGEALARAARAQLADELPAQLSLPLADLEPELAWRLLASLPHRPWPAAAEAQVARWVRSETTLEAITGSARMLLCALAPELGPDIANARMTQALVARLFQCRPWSEQVKHIHCDGRRTAEQHLRQHLGELLQYRDSAPTPTRPSTAG